MRPTFSRVRVIFMSTFLATLAAACGVESVDDIGMANATLLRAEVDASEPAPEDEADASVPAPEDEDVVVLDVVDLPAEPFSDEVNTTLAEPGSTDNPIRGLAPKREKRLNVEFQAQKRDYWCGPAVMSMALQSRGLLLAQEGARIWLGTELMDKTPFRFRGWYPMQVATNNVLEDNGQRMWFEAKDKSKGADIASSFKKDVLYNIDRGWPLMVHVIEKIHDVHLPGHPRELDIGHWILVYGYDSGGDNVYYMDPAAYSPVSWSGPQTRTYYYQSNQVTYSKPRVYGINKISTKTLIYLMENLGYIA
jgi:hypothetical protein